MNNFHCNIPAKLTNHLINFYIAFHDNYYGHVSDMITKAFRDVVSLEREMLSDEMISENEFNATMTEAENTLNMFDDVYAGWFDERKFLQKIKHSLMGRKF